MIFVCMMGAQHGIYTAGSFLMELFPAIIFFYGQKQSMFHKIISNWNKLR